MSQPGRLSDAMHLSPIKKLVKKVVQKDSQIVESTKGTLNISTNRVTTTTTTTTTTITSLDDADPDESIKRIYKKINTCFDTSSSSNEGEGPNPTVKDKNTDSPLKDLTNKHQEKLIISPKKTGSQSTDSELPNLNLSKSTDSNDLSEAVKVEDDVNNEQDDSLDMIISIKNKKFISIKSPTKNVSICADMSSNLLNNSKQVVTAAIDKDLISEDEEEEDDIQIISYIDKPTLQKTYHVKVEPDSPAVKKAAHKQ